MVEDGPHTFVVDAGPDFRLQMLRNNVRKLDGLLITHEHKDHVAGLDDVRAFNYIQNKSMPVFGLPRVLDHIRIEFAYAFAEKKYPGVPQIELIDIGHDPFSSQGFNIIPIPVMHAKLPILGFRFGDFAYITDCNYLSPESMELIRGSKVLVLNALQKTHHISHYTLEEAIAVANVLEVPQVYFTHISHRMGLHKEVEKELPSHIRLANDGLIIEI
mgnify:FL=1